MASKHIRKRNLSIAVFFILFAVCTAVIFWGKRTKGEADSPEGEETAKNELSQKDQLSQREVPEEAGCDVTYAEDLDTSIMENLNEYLAELPVYYMALPKDEKAWLDELAQKLSGTDLSEVTRNRESAEKELAAFGDRYTYIWNGDESRSLNGTLYGVGYYGKAALEVSKEQDVIAQTREYVEALKVGIWDDSGSDYMEYAVSGMKRCEVSYLLGTNRDIPVSAAALPWVFQGDNIMYIGRTPMSFQIGDGGDLVLAEALFSAEIQEQKFLEELPFDQSADKEILEQLRRKNREINGTNDLIYSDYEITKIRFIYMMGYTTARGKTEFVAVPCLELSGWLYSYWMKEEAWSKSEAALALNLMNGGVNQIMVTP